MKKLKIIMDEHYPVFNIFPEDIKLYGTKLIEMTEEEYDRGMEIEGLYREWQTLLKQKYFRNLTLK